MRASKNKQHFLLENEELRTRLEEAEETLRAIRAGEVDALFRAFVMKPFTIREGAELVRRVLDQNRTKESPSVRGFD